MLAVSPPARRIPSGDGEIVSRNRPYLLSAWGIQVSPDSVGQTLPFSPGRGHLFDESSDLGGKFGMALGNEDVTGCAPAAFDYHPRFDQL